MALNVSDIVWHRLHEWEIERVHGCPGDLDVALEQARDTMQHTRVRHEVRDPELAGVLPGKG